MVLAEWQVGQVVWSMLWFTMFFLWIWVMVVVFGDIFRSRDLSGWGKALWTLFIIFLPFLGAVSYFIARGSKMGQHQVEDAQRADLAMRAYIRDTVASTPADDLSALVDLRDRGLVTQEEYEAMRARIVPTTSA